MRKCAKHKCILRNLRGEVEARGVLNVSFTSGGSPLSLRTFPAPLPVNTHYEAGKPSIQLAQC